MKKTLALVALCVIVGGALWANPCVASQNYDTQKGAALGAVGALAGQTSGALVGAAAGNVVEQTDTHVMLVQAQPPAPQGYGPPPPAPQGYGPPPEGALPPYAFAAPPDVVPIQGTGAYFVPGIGIDVFFYGGYWYRSFRGRWYGAPSYNGPWMYVAGPRVPRVFFSLPVGWRRVPPGYRPIPHGELHRNWQKWDREKHWDGHR